MSVSERKKQKYFDFYEPPNEIRAEYACMLCLMRRTATQSTTDEIRAEYAAYNA